jgi:uncharacterized membrane protein YtjA (UPF0391 family)
MCWPNCVCLVAAAELPPHASRWQGLQTARPSAPFRAFPSELTPYLPTSCVAQISLARFKPRFQCNMLSWAVTILILTVVAALLAFWGVTGLTEWLLSGLFLLLIILCAVAVFFA